MKKGDRFGRLVVLALPQARFDVTPRFQLQAVLVRCQCGVEKEVWKHHLLSGRVKSCGCLRREMARKRMTTHGQTKTRLYQTWYNMLRRCEDVKSSGYAKYGAKGITVCLLWHRFENFASWAQTHGYKDTLLIDRIDNEQGYYPLNCRWATPRESCLNRRPIRGHCVQRSDGERFISVRAAGRVTGIAYVGILKVLRGKQKTAGGYTWTYYDEESNDD